MYILITRDTHNGTFATRTFNTEQDVLTVLRDEMLDAVKRFSDDETDYDMVTELFGLMPYIEQGYTHEMMFAVCSAEVSRTFEGHLHMEAECSDRDEDPVYEWFVDYINPTAPTN